MAIIKNLTLIPTILILFFPLSLIIGPAFYELNAIFLIIIYFISNSNKSSIFQNLIQYKFYFYIYFFLIFVSFFSININISLKESLPFSRHILFSIALLYFIKNDLKIIEKIYKIFQFIIILFFLDSLIQYIFGTNIIGFKQQNPFRISSFFYDELIMGSFFLRLFPIFTALHYFTKKKFDNFFFLYIFIFEIIIFISGERSSLILFNFFILLLFLIMKDLRKKLLLVSILIIAIFISFITLDKNLKQRFIIDTIEGLTIQKNEFEKKKINFISYEHESHYITALNIFKDNILTGSGPKTFRIECKKKEYLFNQFGCATHPHNFYIEMLSDTGIFGFILLFFIYLFILNQLIKNYKNNHTEYSIILLGFLIFLFPLSPTGSIFNNFISYFNFMYLTFLIFFKPSIK